MPILQRQAFHRNIERMINAQTYQPSQVVFVEEQWSLDRHKDPIILDTRVDYVSRHEPGAWTYTQKKIDGLPYCTGDLIVIMSSDDYYGPEYIERWVKLMQTTDSPIARFRGHWVYNIVDRRYGFVKDVSGGHSVYMREWALENYDSNEHTLNYIDMPRTNELVGQFAIIRHTPAGGIHADGFRRTAKSVGQGHTCGTEATDLHDPDGSWLRDYISDPAVAEFYLQHGEHLRGVYPYVPE
jgi:hypothetical protein